jgi:hypothetical protein
MYQSTRLIGTDLVSIVVEDDNYVSFTVNNSMFYEDRENKVAITRWLLTQFAYIKSQYSLLHCSAFCSDNNKEYREKLYIKLGFKPYHYNLAWGITDYDHKEWLKESESYEIF